MERFIERGEVGDGRDGGEGERGSHAGGREDDGRKEDAGG